MTPFLSKITGNFDGLFGIFFGKDGVTIGNQAFDLGLTKKYKWAGDGAIAESTNLPALGNKIEGFVGINRYIPVLDAPLNTPAHKKFFDEAKVRLQADRSLRSAARPLRAVELRGDERLKLGMEKSKFRGREDTDKLIEALEGLEMKEGDDFPQGDKTLRKEDHQAFLRQFISEIKDGKHRISRWSTRTRRSSRRPASSPKCKRDASVATASPADRPGRRDGPCAAHRGPDHPLWRADRAQQRQFRGPRGEIRAIIGPNGAGKSTFFNCLTGVLRPTSGRILLNGEDITGLPPNLHLADRHRALLPDHQHPAERHDAGKRAHRRAVAPARLEHADATTATSATSSTRPRRCSTSVGLAGKADELAANLSHGEQRNLEIGIALATEPQLLCLDEPTAGMSAAETHDTMPAGAPASPRT